MDKKVKMIKRNLEEYGSFMCYLSSAVLFSSHLVFPWNREDTIVFTVVFKRFYLVFLFQRNRRDQRLSPSLVSSCSLRRWACGQAAQPHCLWELPSATDSTDLCLTSLWNRCCCGALQALLAVRGALGLKSGAAGLETANLLHVQHWLRIARTRL